MCFASLPAVGLPCQPLFGFCASGCATRCTNSGPPRQNAWQKLPLLWRVRSSLAQFRLKPTKPTSPPVDNHRGSINPLNPVWHSRLQFESASIELGIQPQQKGIPGLTIYFCLFLVMFVAKSDNCCRGHACELQDFAFASFFFFLTFSGLSRASWSS